MSFLLKFNYERNHYTFVVLKEDEYRRFRARDGNKRDFVHNDVNYHLVASVSITFQEEAWGMVHNQELYNTIHQWLTVCHIGPPLPQGLISLILNQLSPCALVNMYKAIPFYQSIIKVTLAQRFTEFEILLALIGDEKSAISQLYDVDHSIIPLTPFVLDKYKIWEYEDISRNKSLPLDFIEQNLEYFNINYLCCNPAFLAGSNPEILIDKFIDRINWDELSYNPALINHERLEFLLERYVENWNWNTLSARLSVGTDILLRYQDYWSWSDLSRYIKLSEELIEKFLNRWDWVKLSANESLTTTIIDRYLLYWDWLSLACNPVLVRDINCDSRKKYLFYIEGAVNELVSTFFPLSDGSQKLLRLAERGYLSLTMLEKLIGVAEWVLCLYSSNPNLSMEMVERYAEDVDWWRLSYNSCFLSQITMDFLERYCDKPWNWKELYKEIRGRLPEASTIYLRSVDDPDYNLLAPEKVLEIVTDDEYNTREERLSEILSKHEDLNLPFILSHPEIKWDWVSITIWAKCSWEDMLQYPDLPWSSKHLLHRFRK